MVVQPPFVDLTWNDPYDLSIQTGVITRNLLTVSADMFEMDRAIVICVTVITCSLVFRSVWYQTEGNTQHLKQADSWNRGVTENR